MLAPISRRYSPRFYTHFIPDLAISSPVAAKSNGFLTLPLAGERAGYHRNVAGGR
jgi:hypothetical protein